MSSHATKVSPTLKDAMKRAPTHVRALEQFEKSAKRLSDSKEALIGSHNGKWVAVHKGDVIASADGRAELLRLVDEAKVPRNQVIVRLIQQRKRTLIL